MAKAKSGLDWSMAGVWNDSIVKPETRATTERDYLWASELGKAPIDVILGMSGEKPTNPPNPRSLRKFEAGHMFEWIVGMILERAGLCVDKEVHCSFSAPGLLEVTGRADFIAGGGYDFISAAEDLKDMGAPEVFVRIARDMEDAFDMKYDGEPLLEKPIEVKSVSAFVFEGLLKKERGAKNHRLQLMHYLKALDYKEGSLFYVCRDDMRVLEVVVRQGGEDEEEYLKAVKALTEHYFEFQKTRKLPPKEEPIIFDEDMGKFTKNWKVAYSNYLTMVYGFKDQAEFDAKYQPIPPRWNRVLTRYKNGDKMTKKNLEAITEMAEYGFNVPVLLAGFEPDDEEEPKET